MKNPTMICRCEDITLEDIKNAFSMGFTDIESLRRHLMIGTGPCQGKTCIPMLEKIISEMSNKDFRGVITTRPPESPISFGSFLHREENEKL